MQLDDINNICVVGAGNMGHQIALQAAICGFKVTCTDINQATLDSAEQFVDRYLPERVAKGRLTEAEAKQARDNIRFESDLAQAAGNADLVIEAVVEVLAVKRKLFAELDAIAPSHAILATNSSFIVSSRIADATQRPDKVLNMHFFNPALVMKLVEVVKGDHVSEETAALAVQVCEKLQKVPVLLNKEVEGFLLNRIFAAISREALWLLEMGVASVEDIDKACVHGAGHPMGPYTLNDLTGLDLSYTVAMEKFRETGDVADLPPPSLVGHVVKGEYGKKAGKGWYDYS